MVNNTTNIKTGENTPLIHVITDCAFCVGCFCCVGNSFHLHFKELPSLAIRTSFSIPCNLSVFTLVMLCAAVAQWTIRHGKYCDLSGLDEETQDNVITSLETNVKGKFRIFHSGFSCAICHIYMYK